MLPKLQKLLHNAQTYWQNCRRHDGSATRLPTRDFTEGAAVDSSGGISLAAVGLRHEDGGAAGGRGRSVAALGDADLRGIEPADVDYFQRGRVENPEFWRRLVDQPRFQGKQVLDVGCGLGALCVDMASAGAARVVGLDTEAKLIAFARQYTARAYPHLGDTLEFYDEDLGKFDQDNFDIIVSKDSFEHIMDLNGMLRSMTVRLKPGGRIYAGFGPLYNSPFGHHGRVATRLPWRQFPWAHLWESEAKIVERLNRLRDQGEPVFAYQEGPLTGIRDLGLSMYSLADYRRFIYGSGLKVVRFEANRSKQPLSHLLSVLRQIPALEEYCTHNIYCILEKPLTRCAG